MTSTPRGAVTPPLLDAAYAGYTPDQLLQEVARLLLPPSDGVEPMPPTRQLTYKQVRDYTTHQQEILEGDPGQGLPSYVQVRDNVAETRKELTTAASILSGLETKVQTLGDNTNTKLTEVQSVVDGIRSGLSGSLDPVLQRADQK